MSIVGYVWSDQGCSSSASKRSSSVILLVRVRFSRSTARETRWYYSFSTINTLLGSSLSNSYLSDHEPSSSPTTISMQPHYQQQYRTGNPKNRGESAMIDETRSDNWLKSSINWHSPSLSLALISVSSAQSPLITIASGGSPSRSEIRLSSAPKNTKSTLREIRISRPDSPTISINRSPSNQPITFTSNTNGGTITNGSGGAFHISVGAPNSATQRGRTSPVRRTNPMLLCWSSLSLL